MDRRPGALALLLVLLLAAGPCHSLCHVLRRPPVFIAGTCRIDAAGGAGWMAGTTAVGPGGRWRCGARGTETRLFARNKRKVCERGV